ncbi:RES family NAD+ phosphorylase [Flavobacterium salilacus subsp. salilacus]|uniref:RES domain-containing protein n=1 Tax=Flavobacterium TaxID=237 RepID=UPI0010754C69|nr:MULTISPECIES: RES domain-containing protein [Flavobacterium]KAF2518182.1 RES family NAD+ phosphorylase [Flavobacterium salilacus subsp. salilacus]MBE1615506.1 RES domain-containing protein [Flavobacterium sp. SaA2.13]
MPLNVCKNCFSDRELVGFIISQAITDKCDFCGSTSNEVIPISELFEFFRELFENFQIKENGNSLKSTLQGNWGLFSSLESADKVLNYLIDNIDVEISNADELVDFREDIIENISYWDSLKEQLKWERRYFTDINYITDELGWDGFFNSQIIINKDTKLYRARLHHSSSQNPFEVKDMFCPPKHISSAGRANPLGIPFLYLSDTKETVLYEIRASYLDEVSIGIFTTNKEKLIIADFTENSTIFHPSRVTERIKATLLKQKISTDLSRPMRRYDTELDYIPTQFICEFIKIYTGASGIKFRSSLHTIGNNIVIFDEKVMNCEAVEKVKVNRVRISAL